MPTAKRKQALAPSEIVIPEKIYFRIGEVSELAKLPTYVLRFWETEFPQLRPTKSSTGQRMYRRRDVEFVMQIRKLLYEDGFTIAGARERLREQARLGRVQEGDIRLSTPMSGALGTPTSEPAIVAEVEASKGRGGLRPSKPTAGLPGTPTLPFPVPLEGPASAIGEHRRRALHDVRRQLAEVLDLLS